MINVLREIDSLIEFLEAKKGKVSPAIVKKLMGKLARQRGDLAKNFEPVLVKVLEMMGEQVEKAFKQYQQIKRESLREADGDMIRWILEELNLAKWIIPEFKAKYEQFYQEVYHATFGTISDTIGGQIGLTLGSADEAVRKVIEAGGKRVGLLDMESQVKDKLFEVIGQGRDDGLGVEALARLIRAEIPAGPWKSVKYRAEVIAKTETKYAQNVSAIESYRQSDAVTGLQAMDNLTGFDDPECIARDGEVFSFDDAEQETQDEHPNGTLTWAPVTDES